MPQLDPPPEYGSDTPEIADFYSKLGAGLGLTLDGERDERERLRLGADDCEPTIAAARRTMAPLEEAHEAATARLESLLAQPAPRSGLQALRSAKRDALEALEDARARVDGALAHQRTLRRGVQLRTGSTRPRQKMQHGERPVGSAPYGVYAFYDFDGRAMYVGKTSEGVSVRVRRHLTNQRTDAVAMSVLDPLEVAEVEVWPFWPADNLEREAAAVLIAGLEYAVEQACTQDGSSLFNEKRIPPVEPPPELPASVRFDALSPESRARLGHPDIRIARRAAVSARLASRIVERSLKNVGLRRSLGRQLARLTELADARFQDLGGEEAVEITGQDD
jgi:hypothetical protein